MPYLAVNKTNAYNVINNANYTSIPMYAGEYVTINYTYDKDSSTPLVLDHDTYYDGSDTVELTNGARNAGTYSVTASLDLGVGELIDRGFSLIRHPGIVYSAEPSASGCFNFFLTINRQIDALIKNATDHKKFCIEMDTVLKKRRTGF